MWGIHGRLNSTGRFQSGNDQRRKKRSHSCGSFSQCGCTANVVEQVWRVRRTEREIYKNQGATTQGQDMLELHTHSTFFKRLPCTKASSPSHAVVFGESEMDKPGFGEFDGGVNKNNLDKR